MALVPMGYLRVSQLVLAHWQQVNTALGATPLTLKGGSSRFVSSELTPGEWFDWQDHYGAFSVSPRERSKIIADIENQKCHHAEGTLFPNAEETEEESDVEMLQPI